MPQGEASYTHSYKARPGFSFFLNQARGPGGWRADSYKGTLKITVRLITLTNGSIYMAKEIKEVA